MEHRIRGNSADVADTTSASGPLPEMGWTGRAMKRFVLMVASLGMSALALVFWPVDALVIRDEDDTVVLRSLMPLGRSFETEYIHSVQLSPVQDVYFLSGGVIRQWETRVQSQNAGITSLVLPQGRFRIEPPWLVFEGQAMALAKFVLRVGTDVIGRNRMRFGNGDWQPLYPSFAGQRLYVEAARQSLYGGYDLPACKWIVFW